MAETPPVLPVAGQELIQSAPAPVQELTEEDKALANISAIAKSFAEIYGSYSNQSNYSNLEAVLPLLTSRYRPEIASALDNYRASYKPGETYEGATTVALTSRTGWRASGSVTCS